MLVENSLVSRKHEIQKGNKNNTVQYFLGLLASKFLCVMNLTSITLSLANSCNFLNYKNFLMDVKNKAAYIETHYFLTFTKVEILRENQVCKSPQICVNPFLCACKAFHTSGWPLFLKPKHSHQYQMHRYATS